MLGRNVGEAYARPDDRKTYPLPEFLRIFSRSWGLTSQVYLGDINYEIDFSYVWAVGIDKISKYSPAKTSPHVSKKSNQNGILTHQFSRLLTRPNLHMNTIYRIQYLVYSIYYILSKSYARMHKSAFLSFPLTTVSTIAIVYIILYIFHIYNKFNNYQ